MFDSFQVVVDKMDVLTIAQDNVALCAAIGRVINMATEEMTRFVYIVTSLI